MANARSFKVVAVIILGLALTDLHVVERRWAIMNVKNHRLSSPFHFFSLNTFNKALFHCSCKLCDHKYVLFNANRLLGYWKIQVI
jgi:hypothetical protein